MITVYSPDQGAIDATIKLANQHVSESRERHYRYGFKSISDLQDGDIVKGDKIVVASGVKYDPETKEMSFVPGSDKNCCPIVEVEAVYFKPKFDGAQSEKIGMLKVRIPGGEEAYLVESERFAKVSEIFDEKGGFKSEFKEIVAGDNRRMREKRALIESDLLDDLDNVARDSQHISVVERKFDLIIRDAIYIREDIKTALMSIVKRVLLKPSPDIENDLGLNVLTGAISEGDGFSIGMDTLTGKERFMEIRKLIYDPKGNLERISIGISELQVVTDNNGVQVYDLRPRSSALLTPYELKAIYKGKRVKFEALEWQIGLIRNERHTDLLESLKEIYVNTYCNRLRESKRLIR